MEKTQHKTQGGAWHSLFVLLDTTNQMAEPHFRKTMARNKDVKKLRATCIGGKKEEDHSWYTRRLPIRRLTELAMEECEVGYEGTSLPACLKSVEVAIHAFSAECELHKHGSTAELVIMGLRGRQDEVYDQLATDLILQSSGPAIKKVGTSSLRISWEIPVRKRIVE